MKTDGNRMPSRDGFLLYRNEVVRVKLGGKKKALLKLQDCGKVELKAGKMQMDFRKSTKRGFLLLAGV